MTEHTTGQITVIVVIPTHNRPHELSIAIRSVLEQEPVPGVALSIVVVDEGSDPPAATTLGPLTPYVTLLRNEVPRGPAAARNQGALAAPADYVAFLDDDDRWLPGKVHNCLEAFDAFPGASLVFHRVSFDDSEAGNASSALVAHPIRRMLHHQPPHLDGVMVPAALHATVQFDETFRAAEDLDYLLRVAATGPVVELGAVLAVHGTPTFDGSSISVERRIEGRRKLREKHVDVFDRVARAHSDLRIGHQYRRLGRPWSAARAFAGAASRRPLWASPWKGFLALVMPAATVQRFARTPRKRSTPVV